MPKDNRAGLTDLYQGSGKFNRNILSFAGSQVTFKWKFASGTQEMQLPWCMHVAPQLKPEALQIVKGLKVARKARTTLQAKSLQA
jgi:hypothetical protein